MIGLIIIVLFWIITTVLSLQCGAEIVALYLHKRHRINEEEYKELISLKFIFNRLKENE